MAILGEDDSFTFIEYQALMFCLVAGICLGLLVVEFAMRRFQVLPVIFPGMFSVRDRRFFFFDFEVRDGVVAERLRWRCKVLICATLCVVMSYLWQRCVLETVQLVTRNFPHEYCDANMDCFASELHISTVLRRSYDPIDCSARQPFSSDHVISCVRFVMPSATDWLMHIAIAHSVTQLNIKCFEVFVQLAGNSICIKMFFAVSFSVAVMAMPILYITGYMSRFVSSWLSFVMAFSVPVFLWSVWMMSKVYAELWRQKAEEVQRSIEMRLNSALAMLPGESIGQGNHVQQDALTKKAAKAAEVAPQAAKVSAEVGEDVASRQPAGGSDHARDVLGASRIDGGSVDGRRRLARHGLQMRFNLQADLALDRFARFCWQPHARAGGLSGQSRRIPCPIQGALFMRSGVAQRE
eukprot:CAMPEP_0176063112 /NCGR_PEP_ID=MMETSP0120_2-20121206/31475_1 /TAXON_ID=160619 /ORGANISM="Kryptoperidinium foliaceum, Strain CCMP 1326" /LENGTH=408 /DNA_ID=CAMNT_0017396683 /DNA_START=46 /DNA_END=1271 /DNA_ORIENTATION=+